MDELPDLTHEPPPETATRPHFERLRAIVAAPGSFPAGGMSVQADVLAARLRSEGAVVRRVVTNPQAPLLLATLTPVADSWRRRRSIGNLRDAIREGADVAVVHGASWAYFREVVAPALLECRDAGIRTVLRWDGGDADRFFAAHGDEVRGVLAAADDVAVPSGFLAEVFRVRLGISPRVVANIVRDPDDDRPPARGEGPLRLLCTRHLSRSYGVDVVIRAASEAAAAGTDLRLTVAGDGPERAKLEAMAHAALGDRVRFTGAVPHVQVLAMLGETDVVVNGSWVDNFPVSLAEALAAGVPVATTDAGGVRWVVQHGRTGLVTPMGDVAALAGSIAAFASDRALLEDLGWRAKVEALRWTWRAVRHEWGEMFHVAQQFAPA